jgi:hypothetical protein
MPRAVIAAYVFVAACALAYSIELILSAGQAYTGAPSGGPIEYYPRIARAAGAGLVTALAARLILPAATARWARVTAAALVLTLLWCGIVAVVYA